MFFLLLFSLGLLVGSFISAFTYRYPRKIQFLTGRSFCPKCKKIISWFDNIPLLSFILLGGRCRNCNKPISRRYPLIELAGGVGFLLVPRSPALPAGGLGVEGLALFCILLAIFVIDLEHQIIPDGLIFLGMFFALFLIPGSLTGALFAGFLSASLLLLIYLATRGRGMGLGDVKFAVLGGMIVGLKLCLPWLFLAFLTGGIVGVILILGGKKKLKDKIAFGPFLVIAIPVLHLLSLSSWFRLYLFWWF